MSNHEIAERLRLLAEIFSLAKADSADERHALDSTSVLLAEAALRLDQNYLRRRSSA